MFEGAEQVKVLLVDDDEVYVKVTKMYFEANGLNIKCSTSPVEALKICQKENIDVVLLDYFMPEMTGEEFVKKLREANNQALVILQTGFAEKKPPIETLTTLDIQGYYDKTKEADELLLLTLSAIKMMKLLKSNKMQELKLNSLNYKKQLIGELTVGLLNETRDQLMSIGAANQSIKMNTNDYSDENALIEKANEKINKAFNAISFEYTEIMTVDDMVETIKILFASKKKENLANISISTQGGTTGVKKNADTLVFLIIETLLKLLDSGANNIVVEISGATTIDVKFNNEIKSDKEFMRKIVMILIDQQGIKYRIVNNKVEISMENL